MRHRPLGASGLVVSVVGLGCNNFGKRLDLDGTREVVSAALDVGITFFDTADSYGNKGGSERLLGETLGRRRREVVLATKFGSDMAGAYGPDFDARASRRYIRTAVEGSLRRLRTDYIDLYQLHKPDFGTPLEETLAALTDLVRDGKVRYVGSANLAAWQVADAAWIARSARLVPFISAQNEYSLLERQAERELVPACLRHGVGLIPFYPLAGGLLTGKYSLHAAGTAPGRLSDRLGGYDRSVLDRVEALRRLAAERARSPLDYAIGGLAAKPAVASVIAGAMSATQVRANAAAGDWQPDGDDLAALDAVAPPGVSSATPAGPP